MQVFILAYGQMSNDEELTFDVSAIEWFEFIFILVESSTVTAVAFLPDSGQSLVIVTGKRTTFC